MAARDITSRSIWPDFYPPDCPPESVPWASGSVLRFIRGEAPKPEDFVPLLLANREVVRGEICQGAGLSVFTNFGDVARMRRRFPSYRKRLVAIGELSREHGKLKSTPSSNCSSHQTWWTARDLAPAEFFTSLPYPGSDDSPGP